MKKSVLFTSLAAFCLAFLMFPQTVHAAGFVQDAAGVKYQNDDGSFLIDSWVQIGQNIYRLDANGIVQTGWIQVGNLWYFLDANGVCTNPAGTATPPAELTAAPVPVSAAATTAASAAAPTSSDVAKMFAAAGWVPFQTADAALLSNGISAGLIGTDGIQYWAEPTFAAATAQTAVQQAASWQTVPALQFQYVWLSATGKKYHSINHCGNMDPTKAIYVTLEEAVNRGKEPCKNCIP